MRRLALLATVALLVGLPAIARADRRACTDKVAGGDWATYGGDLQGTQTQPEEATIDKSNVASLQEIWRTGQIAGDYASPPPIVAGGCVFINTGGHVEAHDLRTGTTVWTSSGADTSGTYAVTVANGRVHVGLNNNGHPKAAAFDVSDGHLLWISDDEIYFGHETTQQASAIVYKGLQVLFTTGPDNDPEAMQGYGIIDAETGHVLYKSTTIPPEQLAEGYRGGGVWGTPTVDPRTGYLYVGTSNPESKTMESDYDDSIIKLDLNRDRPTFGKIVATYKGTPDSVTGYDNPVCQTVGGTAWVNAGIYGASPTCGQTDVDFGTGPTLWRDRSTGRLMGAATQKSGWLHVFYADTMTKAWDYQVFVSLAALGGNICRIATDGQTLYVATNPGVLWAFDAATGNVKWRQPLVGAAPQRGGNVALANGVLYYVNDLSAEARDPATGDLLWQSPPTPAGSIGSGVAVAGNSVVANHYGTITAYRLPGT